MQLSLYETSLIVTIVKDRKSNEGSHDHGSHPLPIDFLQCHIYNEVLDNRAVYTRENKPWIVAHVSRELSHLYDNSLFKKLVRERAANEHFVPFIRAVRGLNKPRIV